MAQKRVITDLINEMNSLALSVDSPAILIKWALISVPELMASEMAAVALVRYDSVLTNYSAIPADGTGLAELFKDKVKEEIGRLSSLGDLVWQDEDFYEIEPPAEESPAAPNEIKSFSAHPLIVRDQAIGYIATGSSRAGAFPKFKLNMLENFCGHFARGLKSLLDRNIVMEQSRLLEEEKRKLEDEKRKIETIMRGMKEGLVITGNDGNVITINAAARLALGFGEGYEMKVASGFIINELMCHGDNECGENGCERDVTLKEPRQHVVHVSTTPIYDSEHQLVGKATLLTDVTKEKEVEQMKSDFVSAVSHELRTPLTSIREAVAIVAEGITGPVNDKQMRCLNVALQDTDRLARIVNDLLDLSRIESGKVQMKRTSVVVRDLVGHVTASLSHQAKAGNIEIVPEIEEDVPSVFADPDQMIQVLVNLAGNAVKFTPAGGRITISAGKMKAGENAGKGAASKGAPDTASAAGCVRISVRDTGPGISAEDQNKLFKKFSQVDSGLTRKVGGTGLGLSIAKEIVQMHGGEIWVVSSAGAGSTFSFSVPVFTIESAYLDLFQQALEAAKEARSSLALVVIDRHAGGNLSEEDKKVLLFLESVCRNNMRRKEDLVFRYRDGIIFIIVEADRDGAERLVVRIKEESRLKFDYRIAGYPKDGVTPEKLIRKAMEKRRGPGPGDGGTRGRAIWGHPASRKHMNFRKKRKL